MRNYASFVVWCSWAVLLLVMLSRAAAGRDVVKRDPTSRIGILIVAVGFAFFWAGLIRHRPSPALAPGIGAVLAVLSGALGVWARFTLGRQWSIQARLRTGHQLVTTGPYQLVRHPIYLALFGLLVGTGLLFAERWLTLTVAAAFYLVGTTLRIRAEERLLREQFGETFEDYVRRTGALLPFL